MSDVCEWHGIICETGDGHVTRIELENNRLSGSGTLPSELWTLPHLRHVNLRSNWITNAAWDEFLDSDDENDEQHDDYPPRAPVETIMLSENHLSSLSGIRFAKDTLRYLNLNKNQIEGPLPDEVFDLDKLETLYVAFNQLSGTMPTLIGKLTRLEELYTFSNELTGPLPSELGRLDKCRILGLGDNLWTGTIPTQVENMVNLHEVSIHQSKSLTMPIDGKEYSRLTGPLPTFGDMPYLTMLHLDGNSLSGTIPSDLFRLNNCTDSLVSIGLAHNNISGSLPITLERFEKLTIDLAGNRITNVPSEFCEKDGWMGGLVEEYRCDAILCPLGTYNRQGRALDNENLCAPCSDGQSFLGATSCVPAIVNREDWRVLADFYLATAGDKWANKKGWEVFDVLFEEAQSMEQWNDRIITVCDDWYGIQCQDGKPRKLYLSANELFGTVPDSIFLIPWANIDLSDNNIIVVNLDAVGTEKLSSLSLSNVKLRSLDGVEKLRGLDQLYLDGLSIDEPLPEALFSLTGLKILHLQHGRSSGTLPTLIGGMTSLERYVTAF